MPGVEFSRFSVEEIEKEKRCIEFLRGRLVFFTNKLLECRIKFTLINSNRTIKTHSTKDNIEWVMNAVCYADMLNPCQSI